MCWCMSCCPGCGSFMPSNSSGSSPRQSHGPGPSGPPSAPRRAGAAARALGPRPSEGLRARLAVQLRVIAVGTRMPEWVDAAFEDYSRRLSGSWKLELKALPPASRREAGGASEAAKALEAKRILALLSAGDIVVPLDERGEQLSTLELARWLETQR